MTGVAPAIFAITIYLRLLPEIDFAPAVFMICIASGFRRIEYLGEYLRRIFRSAA